MPRSLGNSRNDLIDLLTSDVGRMVARRIDEAHGHASASADVRRTMNRVAARMAELVRAMSRDQLEACDAELNAFFGAIPFSEAMPVAVEVELKWPHHIETLPEANQRLNLIRKGGQYAMLFSEQKVADVLACIAKTEARR